MKTRVLLTVFAVGLLCAASLQAQGPATPPQSTVREAAANWHWLDPATDQVRGIGLLRAQRELLAGKQPRRTIVVAVIDSGVDTTHVDLRGNLWVNPKEVAGNGRDDDSNGYVDDVFGWNFIGGRDGQNVHKDTYEVTRLFALCRKKAPEASTLACDSIASSFEEKRREAELTLAQVNQIAPALETATRLLKDALRTDTLTLDKVQALRPLSAAVQQAKLMFEQLAANGITAEVVREAREEFESRLKYGYNPEFDPRAIVGDNPADANERRYGNRDVMGPDSKHGTHVAGIIAAMRDNDIGVNGIAPAVRIISIRAVPDGDERDKDVANAVRYAVDQGAHIINMSFGKGWSPGKAIVDAAMEYAQQRGVLLVHAAGNDGDNLAENRNYPTPVTAKGRIANWIEVGASSWRGADTIAASFSNYGREHVDVFAPGEDILSTVPGSAFDRESGTSMAAPVVSGVAALLMAYYPQLSAADVKRVILESATKLGEQTTLTPGRDGTRATFGTLSATGGIVNVYNAVQVAEKLTAGKK